ncbi:MAG: response regulator transcription factor [Clostridia bacterium]|jgi:DNA-binding response OmpR family regulator|nr:response regulator transcription factor [Clostridia bacterium]MBQ9189389.1 response regulator transcription factor [Clostridia bacterium]
MIRILIVDDEQPIANLIRMNLARQGYDCTCAYDGQEAADLLEKNPFDLVLLDIMLPKYNGYDLLAFIRPMNIPVIFLTAKSDVGDRVKGLKLGAEDYIVKPFEIIELVARIEVVLRRYNKTQSYLEILDIVIDFEGHTVIQNGKKIDLTRKEFDLLVVLCQNPNTALFRESLFEKIWETDYMGETRTLDSHIQRLRRKLGWQDRIKTVHKVGYRLEVPTEEPETEA